MATAIKAKWDLCNISQHKAPRQNGIYPVLLQQAGEITTEPIVRLNRASLITGHIPEAWREITSGDHTEVRERRIRFSQRLKIDMSNVFRSKNIRKNLCNRSTT